jgi:tetratricopeptide (TPR) repeat protein
MADGFPDRLTQLRARWQGDPSSRVFLQLAEEYRHLGRVQDALQVLDAGLKEHPGYLSALVAKGRCLLELGDAGAARGVLERVVQQDATQMVANKLLVRAYLETGEPERAGQRLDLYSLLNDSDPEIAELRQRVVAMSRPPRAPDGPRPEEPAERSRMDPTETPSPEIAEVFDLGPAASAHSLAAGDDVFGLGAPGRGEGPAAEPAATVPAGQAALAGHAAPAGQAETAGQAAPPGPGPRGDGNGAEPFPDSAPEQSRRLYLASFAAERIFWFDEAGAQPAPEQVATAASVAEEPVPAAVAAPAADVPVPAAITAPAVESPAAVMAAAPAAESPAAESPAPAATAAAIASVAAAAAVATVTLAELYLRQGHTEEAVRIFGEIVQREPGNAAAREGLARLTGARHAPRQERLDAGQLLAGLNDPQASPTARRAYLLQSYLARLRPRRSHVP